MPSTPRSSPYTWQSAFPARATEDFKANGGADPARARQAVRERIRGRRGAVGDAGQARWEPSRAAQSALECRPAQERVRRSRSFAIKLLRNTFSIAVRRAVADAGSRGSKSADQSIAQRLGPIVISSTIPT